jgi:hypothetical protein
MESAQPTENERQADVAASLRELRQTVEQLLLQVRALEARVRQLESELAAEGVAAELGPSVRPLGRFYVDRHGIILDAGGRAMGVWGVNGQEAVPIPEAPNADYR